MAYTDDLLNAAQRRRARTGNSYFPAANTYRGININAGPSANAINSTPQSQQILSTNPGRYDLTSGRVLPPDQNPAYQAALRNNPTPAARYAAAKNFIPQNLGTLNGVRIETAPLGGIKRINPDGSYSVMPGNASDFQSRAGFVPFSPVAAASLQPSATDPTKSYAWMQGYGARGVAPAVPGGYRSQGGVQTPIENLSPQQRVAGGVGSTTDNLFHSPSADAYWNFGVNNLASLGNAIGGLGRNVASWFGGGNLPSIPPTANAGAPSPSPTPYQTPVPSPTPTATPFKTASDQSDLLRETEGTFYGGGQAPIPTPTPTPGPNRYVLGQPRRYSDYFGYS